MFVWLALGCFLLPAFGSPANAQTAPLVLISESTSTRALAFDSVTFTREPFPLDSLISWSSDRRTRVLLFVLNLDLQPGQDMSNISADAEDGLHRHHELKVESAAPVRGQEWMSVLTLRLSDDMAGVGDVLVRISTNGRTSNRVRLAMGNVGGGLPDDPGSKPTSPYFIRGRVTVEGVGLAGTAVTLAGDGSLVSAITNSYGDYSFVTVGGDYVLSATKSFYDFAPPSHTFTPLDSAIEGVDFVAARQLRTVQGMVLDENGDGIANVELTITGNEITTQKALTDANGLFAFPDLTAGFAYTVTPTSSAVFTFTAQSIDQLIDTTTLKFDGVRRSYTISGRVLDRDVGVASASVKLQETGATSVTDASGNYSFSGVKAGFEYTLVPEKEDYVFEPASTSVPRLEGDRLVDLRGNPHVFLTGRVVDPDNHGIFGIKVTISGTQSGVTSTAADGTFSFLITAFGNYTVTPSKEQDYYAYSPGTISLTGQKLSREAEFDAVLECSLTPSYVLEFDGQPKTVDYSMPLQPGDYNLFWPDGENFGHFFWEFWAMPGENAGGTYFISDGYGGAHAILFGVSGIGSREPGRYQLLGNIWNGTALTYFASDEGPAPHEWGHYAVGWDGKNIVTYFNGIPVGLTPWVGPRITPGGIQGTGRLLIGGSDHSNFIGRIAQVRGYERNNPRAGDDTFFSSFAPQTVFSVDGNLLSYYFRPAMAIADLSPVGQFGRQHKGLVRSTVNGVLQSCSGCPLPQFVVDPTAPDFGNPQNPGTIQAPVDNPATVPTGALVFDSFSRSNSTHALAGLGGLGSTEGGSLGSLPWQTNQNSNSPQPFGILNGRGVLLANSISVAWIDASSAVANFDIAVDRRAGTFGSGHNTGLSFRVADANNYFFAYSSDERNPSNPQTLTVGYYSSGVRTDLTTGILLPAGWTSLRVLTSVDGEIEVYTDDNVIYSTTNTLLANSKGAGLYNNGPGLALGNRWDNFRILNIPQP